MTNIARKLYKFLYIWYNAFVTKMLQIVSECNK